MDTHGDRYTKVPSRRAQRPQWQGSRATRYSIHSGQSAVAASEAAPPLGKVASHFESRSRQRLQVRLIASHIGFSARPIRRTVRTRPAIVRFGHLSLVFCLMSFSSLPPPSPQSTLCHWPKTSTPPVQSEQGACEGSGCRSLRTGYDGGGSRGLADREEAALRGLVLEPG